MAKKKKDISILDVTIRDGSYAISYQYTPEQVGKIAGALDRAGIPFIEVGHGCGIGAAPNIGLPAAATDLQYVEAAKQATSRAKIGVIALPPPVSLPKDINAIIGGVDFIRFAADCDRPMLLEKSIAYARGRRPDITLFLQLMRSTRRPKKDLLAAGRFAEDVGIDIVYIVDTASHFLPEEVEDIVSTLVAKLSIGVGFHGHNNLGMANANSLAAAAAGARSVDASLKGIGRSAGNAQLESLVSLLKRKGFSRKIDLDILIDAGQTLVAPLMPPRFGVDAIDLVTSDANTELYPIDVFQRVAEAAGIELRDIVRTLGRDPRVMEVGPDDLTRVLKKMGGNVQKIFELAGIRFAASSRPRKHR